MAEKSKTVIVINLNFVFVIILLEGLMKLLIFYKHFLFVCLFTETECSSQEPKLSYMYNLYILWWYKMFFTFMHLTDKNGFLSI